FHASIENVSFALPRPASSGTRTGPWKRQPQQNLSSEYRFVTCAPPGAFGGNSTSTKGKTPSGNADLFPLWLQTTTQQPCSALMVPMCPRKSVDSSPFTSANSA